MTTPTTSDVKLTPMEILRKHYDTIRIRHAAAQLSGNSSIENRYWQRLVALDDLIIAFTEAGIE